MMKHLFLILQFSLLAAATFPYHDFHNTPLLDRNWWSSSLKESPDLSLEKLAEINSQIRPTLTTLIEESFFKIYKLNLFKSCPFWNDPGVCMHKSCAVDTIEHWEQLPDIWQPEFLGKINTESNPSPACIDALDGFCELDAEDEECVYVNLVDNPERFTGYGGVQSFQIWKAIYDENCFQIGRENQLENIVSDASDQCLEKNFFYKIVSGMHSSISTHLSNEYLTKTGDDVQFLPNLREFMFKVGDFPDRLENVYLNYVLVLRSLQKLVQSGVLDSLEFCEEREFSLDEAQLKDKLKQLVAPFENETHLFDETVFFQDATNPQLKDEFKSTFRNVSRIMDCIHCERCRLWGKLQTTGYGTCLKILFELDDAKDFQLRKTELIALVNTLDRLSKSLASVENFKRLFKQALIDEENPQEEEVPPVFGMPFEEKKPNKLESAKPKQEQSAEKQPPPSQNANSITIWEEFKVALSEVKDAFGIMFRAYKEFPKMLYNLLLIRVNYYWNRFIGRLDYVQVTDDNLYKVDL